MAAASMAPGWYQDPFSSAGYVRWWDGQKWGPSVLLPEGMQVTAPGVPVPLPPPGASGAPGNPSAATPPVAPPPPSSPSSPSSPPTDLPPPPAGWAQPSRPPGPSPYGQQPYGAPAYGTPGYTPPRYGGDPWSAGSPYRLASWGSRAGARLLDLLIEGVIAAPFALYLVWPALERALTAVDENGTLSGDAFQQYLQDVTASSLSLTLISLVVGFLYEVPQNRIWGRTLGKRALGIRIRPRDEDVQLTWGQAVIRWGTYSIATAIVGGLFSIVDYLWPFWDKPWRQTLHDKTARTTVVPMR